MGRSKALTIIAAALALAVVIAPTAQGKKTRKYAVHVTIEVNASSHTVHGDVVSGAPFEICESAKVKIRQSLPGKDKTVAKVKPKDKAWRFAVPTGLRGDQLYAETAAYAVPGRSVRCLGGHSKTVTAL
jgi:hypothetical protein